MSKSKTQILPLIFRCWWMVLFVIFCYGFYLHGMHFKKQQFNELHAKANLLEKRLYASVDKREDLLLQIDSQTDPAWIQLLIKKKLGMVAEGQTKVYFEH